MALLPVVATAQFDFGGGSREPAKESWEEFKLNAKTRVKLDFRNASVDSIISYFSKTSGVTIIKDPALTGSLTLTSPNSLSLSDAFAMLKLTLDLKNFEMKKEGKAIVIRQKRQDNRGGWGGGTQGQGNSGFGGMNMEQMSQMFGGNSRNELKVYPLKNANASQAARVVNEVFAGSQSPFDQFMQQMGTGGMSGFGGNQGFGNQGGRQGQGGGNNPFTGGGRNQGGGGRGGFGRMGFGGSTQTVRASSDDYSNSVIVNAPSADQRQVEALLKQIDKETEQPLKPVVYRLEYAAASDVSVAVQNVLTTNAPRGRGGASSQNVPIEQRFQQAARFGNAQAAFGTVVADVRTNSLVVTATEDNHELITAVLKELDRPIELQSSTFVVPLNNARADLVAQLLNQTFGTRSGTGTGNRNTNTVGRSPQTQNRLNTGNNGGGGGTGRSREYVPSDDEMSSGALNLEGQIDPETGEFVPVVAVQQGGGFNFFQQGGGGQNRQQNQGRQTTGRDAQGRLVNVNDLTNQITVIPDQNTNSLIIVSSPDQVELIKQILNQLDRIPEQVMIETVIVEATLDASSKLGIEWNFSQSRPFGTPGTNGNAAGAFGLQNASPALQGFRYTLTGGALTGFMNALATDKKFQVLSTPRIFTSNNAQAQINISQRVPYVLSSRTDANNNLTFTYAFEDVGIILTVTPRITSNGYVTMEVNQTANDLQGFTDFNAPIINQREADTTVSVKDGETIILGGIIRNSVTSTVKKIPLLGDIPLLGNLFKSTDKSNVKTELLVFLTPRVVRNEDEARKLKEDEVNRLSKPTQKTLDGTVKKSTGPKLEVKDMKDVKKDEKKDDKKGGTGGETQTKPN